VHDFSTGARKKDLKTSSACDFQTWLSKVQTRAGSKWPLPHLFARDLGGATSWQIDRIFETQDDFG